MSPKKTLILTDAPRPLQLAQRLQEHFSGIDVFQSPARVLGELPCIDVCEKASWIASNYSLAISLHCRQIFPPALVRTVRCVNVHPGYNPHNRGWYPHVFSMLNGLPAGITIHEMDERLDHGPIIAQRQCAIYSWDTSESVYEALMQLETELVLEWFQRIRDGQYEAQSPAGEGNLHSKKNYEALKHLDLDRVGRFGDFLNLLRALTHGSYKNAFYVDETGQRVFVRLAFEREAG
jgi:methionyl-tRNA formyltransferase